MKYLKLFYLIISLSVISFLSCKNSQKNPEENPVQEVKENYGSGETSRTYTRINGNIEGTMTDYFPSGALKAIRYFKDGKQDGKTTIYFESGNIKEVQYYSNGLKNGGDTLFYESGKLEFVSEFKDEKKNGYLRKWGEDGKLIYEAKFAMDTLIEVEGKPLNKSSK